MKASEFMGFKNWAVAGDVLNKEKYASKIMTALKDNGYKVNGINPKEESPEVSNNIKDLDEKIEVLDLCINPRRGLEIVKDAADLGIKNVLIQPGAESEEIIEFCKDAGINAVQGCALVELKNLK